MKKITLLFIVMISQICLSQEYYDESGEFHFKQVFEVDNNQDEIYTVIKKWIATNFKDSQEVIQLDTKENIVCKGNFSVRKGKFTDVIDFTMDVAIKDNRYKIEIYNLSLQKDIPYLPWFSKEPSLYTKERYFAEQLAFMKSISISEKRALKQLHKEDVFEESFKRKMDDLHDTAEKLKNQMNKMSNGISSEFKSTKDEW